MTGFTTTEIDLAIKNLQATGQKISTINMRRILGRGSYGTIQQILRQKGFLNTPNEESDPRITPQNSENANPAYVHEPENHVTASDACGSEGIERMIHDAEKTLIRLRNENTRLRDDIERIENEITGPLQEYQSVLKFINNRFFQGTCPEIPEDLLIILRELIRKTKPRLGILHNDKSEYYRDDANKLLKAVFLSRNL